jgi:hypothetical protein
MTESDFRIGYDVTGELAFSTQYGSQEADDPAKLPPINDHILLSCMYGAVADVLPVPQVRTLTSWLPSAWMQGLLKSRAGLRANAGACVAAAIENHKSDKKTHNLLTQLIDAEDPETGMRLDVPDIASEAFAFLYVHPLPLELERDRTYLCLSESQDLIPHQAL